MDCLWRGRPESAAVEELEASNCVTGHCETVRQAGSFILPPARLALHPAQDTTKVVSPITSGHLVDIQIQGVVLSPLLRASPLKQRCAGRMLYRSPSSAHTHWRSRCRSNVPESLKMSTRLSGEEAALI